PQANQLLSGDFSSVTNFLDEVESSDGTAPTSNNFELSTEQQQKLSPEAAIAAKIDKMTAYVEFLNYVSGNVESSRSRYGQWVMDYNAGPTGQERNVYGLYQLNDYSYYQKEAEKYLNAEPLLPIDSIVKEYIAALNELSPKVEEAYTYYDQENYKD